MFEILQNITPLTENEKLSMLKIKAENDKINKEIYDEMIKKQEDKIRIQKEHDMKVCDELAKGIIENIDKVKNEPHKEFHVSTINGVFKNSDIFKRLKTELMLQGISCKQDECSCINQATVSFDGKINVHFTEWE